MNNTYFDLIDQTFTFPQNGFETNNNELSFHGIDLMDIIKRHGSPLKITYLPKIGHQIRQAQRWFEQVFDELQYTGRYNYCYCTKSSHFSFVLKETLKNGAHLETSSAFDIDLILHLFKLGAIDKSIYIVCNGFKTEAYARKIAALINDGFKNVIPVLDNMAELAYYESLVEDTCNVGLRIAAEEEPNFEFYTSRLGIRYADIFDFYEQKIKPSKKVKLKMLHFFINTGIKDTTYYWSELNKSLKVYKRLKTSCEGLDALNIGGGFPFQNSLGFDYDHAYMVKEIIAQIQTACKESNVAEPDIFTEFGKYTVAESGALIFSVLQEKWQNDRELWYMINSSIMATLPDAWSIGERFVLLPINKWNNEYQRTNIGGLSCDQYDYYNAEVHLNQVYLPKLDNKEPLHIGMFHTGAYQDALVGFGGTKHCLIPSPKHLLIDFDEQGQYHETIFSEQQSAQSMLDILGY